MIVSRRRSYSISQPLFDSVPRIRLSQTGISLDGEDVDLNILSQFVKKIVESVPAGQRCEKDVKIIARWLLDSEREVTKDGHCVFDDLPIEILYEVANHVNLQVYDTNELLYLQGEIGNCFHVILSGVINVYDTDVNKIDKNIYSKYVEEKYDNELSGLLKVANTKPDCLSKLLGQVVIKSRFLVGLSRGSNFGEVAVSSPDPVRTASAVAMERSELLSIHKSLYDRTIAKYSKRGNFQQRKMFVTHIDFFKQANSNSYNHIAYFMEENTYIKGAIIINEGDTIKALGFIGSGEVKLTSKSPINDHKYEHPFSNLVFTKPIEYATIGKYGIINEQAIIGGDVDKISRYTIVASNSVKLYSIRECYFKRLIKVTKELNIQKQFRKLFYDRESFRLEKLEQYKESGGVYELFPKIKQEIEEASYQRVTPKIKLSPIEKKPILSDKYPAYTNPIFDQFKSYTATGSYWKRAESPINRPPATPAISSLMRPHSVNPIQRSIIILFFSDSII